MIKNIIIILYFLGIIYPANSEGKTLSEQKNNAHICVCFSPNQNCLQKIIKSIQTAKKSIYMHAYSFTNNEIADALIKSNKRGIKVIVYIDKGREKEKFSKTQKLRAHKVPIIVQDKFKKGIAHNKIMIIDDDLIITGSFNWSQNALRNEENVNFIKSKEVTDIYKNNWEKTIGKIE